MDEQNKSLTSPAFNEEDQEKKLIALAYSQAEKELSEGTASSQIITHFLKLGTERAKLEQAQIELQNSLIQERILSAKEGQKVAEMVNDVLAALRAYSYTPPGATDDHIL